MLYYISKGDAYKHIPRASTVASSTTGVPSVRSSERRDERRVNAFLQNVVTPANPTQCPPCWQHRLTRLGVNWHSLGDFGHVRRSL